MNQLEVPTSITELDADPPYSFLADLAVDNPQLAEAVTNRLPQWKNWMNENIGIPEVTEALLKSIDYVSTKEMAEIVQDWTNEVVNALTANPDRNIVFLSGAGGSQNYFANLVYQQTPMEFRNRINIKGDGQTRNDLSELTEDFDSFIMTDFYIFDDSINSARQINSMVIPDIFDMAEELEAHAAFSSRSEEFHAFVHGNSETKPTFNIRSMRITKDAIKKIRNRWDQRKKGADSARQAEYPETISLNIAGSGQMKTVSEVLEPLDIRWKNDQKPSVLFRLDHVIGDPVLGFFATKIQDNLPAALLKSRNTPADLEPLFTQSDIQTPWKSISNGS